MDELKPCPFLCEMRDFEMESQVIGYLCKAQCEKCPAHNNTVKDLQAENKKLKSDLDGQKLVSKIAYADIKKLGDENERLKRALGIEESAGLLTDIKLTAEIERLKAALKRIAYYRDLNPDMKANRFSSCVEDDLRNLYCTMGDIAIQALGTDTNALTKESEVKDE